MQLAEGYVRTGKPQSAVILLEDYPLSTAAPFSRERVLITAYRDLGEEDAAAQVAADLVEANANDVDALLIAARLYLSQENLDKGRDVIEDAVRVAPGNPEARLMLGRLELSEDRFDAATDNFQAVFDADSKNLLATMGLAQAAVESGNPERALELLERAHLNHPDAPAPALVLANQYLENGRPNDAVAVARTLAEGDLQDLGVVRSVGRIFFAAGAYDEAGEQFQAAVERAPQAVPLMLDLVRTQAGSKEDRAA